MLNPKNFSKIGIGTWGLGGYMQTDPNNNDEHQINSLILSLQLGLNYLESVYMYADGKAIEISANALLRSGVSRNDVFLVLSIYLNDAHSIKEAENRIMDFMKKFNTTYIDNVQFTMGFILQVGLKSVELLVRKLIKTNQIRYSGLINADLNMLRQYHSALGDTQFSHELCFNFEIRETESLGIIQWAQEQGVKNIVYQPLRRNKTAKKMWPLLLKLSEKYKKDQNQILLNWIVSKGLFPIVKSTNPLHIKKNLESFHFHISKTDLELLNAFSVPNFRIPEIDWRLSGNGIEIAQLPDIFDQEYDRQLQIKKP